MSTQNRKFIPEVRDAQYYHPAEHFERMVNGLDEEIDGIKKEMLTLTPTADDSLKHVVTYRVLQGRLELCEQLRAEAVLATKELQKLAAPMNFKTAE